MNKQNLLKIINPILFLVYLLQGVSILLIKSGNANDFILRFHEINAYIFSIIFIIHLILNWGWIKNNYFSKRK